MADSVNVPGDGTVSRKWLLIGAVTVAGIVGFAYLRRARTPATSTTPDETAVTTPTELPPADLGSVETGGGTTSTGLKFITTDAEWTADVLAKMGDLSFDTNAVSIAIGKWLNGQNISQQEEQWIFAAIALGGMPPSGSHPIKLEPTPHEGSGSMKGHRYVVERHIPDHRVSVRGYVKQYSDASVATENNVETAVIATMGDPRNVRSGAPSGFIAGQHPVMLHIVKAT